MRSFLIGILLIAGHAVDAQLSSPTGHHPMPDLYNVVWNTPGPTSAESMPLGNGDIGLNVWVEPAGDLCFYISKTDAWGVPGTDEDPWMKRGGVLMKLGEVRISLTRPGSDGLATQIAPGPDFQQLLRLSQGEMLIREGTAADTVALRIWVDANEPVVRIEAMGASPFLVKAQLEDWRLGNGDTLRKGTDLVWYHRNPASSDPHLANLTFGAKMKGLGMIREDSLSLASTTPKTHQLVSIYPLTATTSSADRWASKLNVMAGKADAINMEHARTAHRAWWNAFWGRSWIYVRGARDAEDVTRGYVLQRFVTACAGRGAYPIKFNGSIFTVDNPNWKNNSKSAPVHTNADFRAWGGQYWFQNTRPMYWPRLMAGDFDMMRPFFGMFRHMLDSNEAQVRRYYGHGGAYFQETAPFWGGLPYMGPEVHENYTNHYFTPILELSMMMLDFYEYTGDRAFARDTLIPIAAAGLEFFDRHFGRDSAGKLLLDPDNSIEMFWKVHDPAPDIAGLHAVLKRMLNLPDELTGASRKTEWKKLLSVLPELPVGMKNGEPVLLPYTGPQTEKGHNVENPELYAIYPFRLFGLGKDNLELAVHTFDVRAFKDRGCWVQDPIQAAMLGKTAEARAYVVFNLTRKEPDLKFPAFWAIGHDYTPDEDNGGNGENGLQQMLLQSDGKNLLLFPAWPDDWDADFKLHAPGGVILEGSVEGGKLKRLVVTPASRRADVVVKKMYF